MVKTRTGRAAGPEKGAILEPLAVGIPEAARLAGVGRSSIYKAMSAGGLASKKIGKRRIILVPVLRRWLEAAQAA